MSSAREKGQARRAVFASLGAVLTALLIAGAAHAADGDFYPGFDADGKLVGTFGEDTALNRIRAADLQPDGKLVVVGERDSEGVVARINPNGTLDSSFGGGDGYTVLDSGTTSGGERSVDLAIQPDGKIVVFGYAALANGNVFVVARVDSSGVLDAGFDGPSGSLPGEGIFRISEGTTAFPLAYAVALSGGQIVLGGTVDTHPVVYRLNAADGTLDSGFGTSGRFTFDFPGSGNSFLFGLTVQADGKIVAVGAPNNLAAPTGVARITTSGTLDTATFGTPNGYVLLAMPPGYFGGVGEDVAIAPSGDIFVSGSLASNVSPFPVDAAVAKVSSAGVLDTAFGTNGFGIIDDSSLFESGYGVALQPDGKVLMAGPAASPNQAFIARFTSTGFLDPVFSSGSPGGVLRYELGDDTSGEGLALSSDGLAYVGGDVGNSSPTFGVAAFQAFAPSVAVIGTDPAGPADDNNPKIHGTADPGSTVEIYGTPDCSGSPVATGTAATFSGAGIPVTVADNTTTEFRAKARWAGGTSACSTSSVTYMEATPPPVPPTLSATVPMSGSGDNNPRVVGTAPGADGVSIYKDALCSDPAAATGTRADFEAGGIPVAVPDNSTTTFYAKASGPGGISGCSTSFLTYAEVTPLPPAKKCKKGRKLKKGKCVKKKRKKK